MVRELGVKNNNNNKRQQQSKQKRQRVSSINNNDVDVPLWKVIFRGLVPIVGMGLATGYLWSTKEDLVNLRAIVAEYRQSNSAVKTLSDRAIMNVFGGGGDAESDRYLHDNSSTSNKNSTTTTSMLTTESLTTDPQQQGEPLTTTTTVVQQQQQKVNNTISIPIQDMSTILYNGCCGLGHRLTRQFAAYHAAHKLGWKFDVRWPGCGGKNIFDELFEQETLEDLASYVTSPKPNEQREFYSIGNEVNGYTNMHMPGTCIQEEFQSQYEMHSSLQKRFKSRNEIDAFIQQNFYGKFAIGIHIRAGNGEVGDFSDKKRQVLFLRETYVEQVSKNIVELVQNNSNGPIPPQVLFVATDTAEYVDLFRKQLQGIMTVVSWQQTLEPEGEGVFAGQFQKKDGVTNAQCLQKWKDMVSDMILLSSTDLLIAGQYSSFTQAMPITMVFGNSNHPNNNNNNNDKDQTQSAPVIQQRYCETHKLHLNFTCYSNRMDWCEKTKQPRQTQSLGANERGGWREFMQRMYSSEQYHGPEAKKLPPLPDNRRRQRPG